MRIILWALLPFLTGLVSAREIAVKPLPRKDPAALGVSAEELGKIKSEVERLIQDGKLVGASVLVMKKGAIVYQENFGHRDREADKPMENDTLFRIFSMTKAITSAAALILMEEGKLKLDDPIEKFLPELKAPKVLVTEGTAIPAKRSPTVRDLLCHTAGFSSARSAHPVSRFYREVGYLKKELPLLGKIAALKTVPLHYQPGDQWIYGISSDVLAAVISRAAGMPFEQFLRQRLLVPLGMNDTSYSVSAEKVGRLSVSYRVRKGKLKVADSAVGSSYLRDPIFKGGGSGLVSTITDYARFLRMIENGGEFQGKRYLKKETVDLMRTNQLPKNIPAISFGKDVRHGTGYGLGFSVRFAHDDRWDKDSLVGEYGWGGAASTHYWLCPQHDLIVITMEQTMPYNWNLEQALKPIIYRAMTR